MAAGLPRPRVARKRLNSARRQEGCCPKDGANLEKGPGSSPQG